jgi:hypothetical protein
MQSILKVFFQVLSFKGASSVVDVVMKEVDFVSVQKECSQSTHSWLENSVVHWVLADPKSDGNNEFLLSVSFSKLSNSGENG